MTMSLRPDEVTDDPEIGGVAADENQAVLDAVMTRPGARSSARCTERSPATCRLAEAEIP